ncbi:chromosome segregation protein SMC [Anoxynatronum buryatiense]|uniref:Chromosome partition protein Smc n=1 Tax=Anoxynatronum buryatiense TaxID=489973 RepID=A0AA45WV76_9CLOT|nr:chromosome segregation protein SMC [Anoxynatronum buryatiense]SMP47038.1 condensin subunit Smc [Anoxynatronum buryatiense]
MRLKKLEMKGFKSFAQRVELGFETGVTAVVGPNGCGKSNIADAIRWVLGEQSARSLRGQKMEDVIFSGTDRKKPQGLAEVTIVFDNNAGMMSVPYQEVAITRRVYRSGESEYFLNRDRCRLKDVKELLMDTGIGKEGYSIIGQGRIDELLSQRGEERRLLFEEAAGIVKYRTRKEEAEKKIKQTNENLSRLKDILLELEEQLEPLRLQAEKAEKYLNLREKIRRLEVDHFLKDITKSDDGINQIRIEQQRWQQMLNEIQTELVLLERELQKSENEVQQCEAEKELIGRRIKEIETELEENHTQHRLHKQHMEHLEDQKNRLNATSGQLQLEICQEKENLLQLEEKLLHQQQGYIEQEEKMAELNERIQLESSQLLQRQNQLENNKAGIIESLNQIAGLKARIERVQALEDAAIQRQQQLQEDHTMIELEADEAQQKHQMVEAELRALKKALVMIAGEMETSEASLEEVERQLMQMEKQLYQLNQEHDQRMHRKNTLVNMEKTFEGFQRGVRNVLRAVQQNPELAGGFHGVIADLLRVPKGYETAIETSLGPALQYLVTDEESQGKKLIDFLKNKHQGRVTVLPINVIKGRALNHYEQQIIEKYEEAAACAIDLISFPSPYQSVFQNLLGRVVVTSDLDTAIRLARELKHQVKLTTIEGDLIQPGGSMTGGSVSAQQDGLLVRKREIEELGNEIHQLAEKRNLAESHIEKLKIKRSSIKAHLMEQRQEKTQREHQLVKCEGEMDHLQQQISLLTQRIQRFNQEQEQLSDHLKNLGNELKQLREELDDKEKELAGVRAEVEREVALQQQLLSQLNELKNIAGEHQVALAAHREKNKALEAEKKNVETRHQSQKMRELQLLKDIEETSSKQTDTHNAMQELKGKETVQNNKLKEEQLNLQQLQDNQNRIQKELRLKQKDRLLHNENQQRLIEKNHQAELRLSKQEWQRQQVIDRLLEYHEMNPTQAKIWLNSQSENALKPSDLPGLKQEMQLLGEVHVGALDEYRRVKERYEFLTSQEEDMLQARQSLETIISELEKHMIQQFQEQFDKIQVQFKSVFQRLFRGGNTELVLQNPEDLLTTGIDIIAQPPGKKFQHLSLLSGGEKALTAISLLFGILLVKPSPFCVLDEIEAALDDANVSRFADFLIDLSEEIQFIVVTHKKQTMERAHTLYGVTMQEKGVSSLLPLKLEEVKREMMTG